MNIQRLTPPGIHAELIVPPPAPVEHDGGFLIGSQFDTYVPQNPCPLDEIGLARGLPITLTIAPTGIDSRYSQAVDDHHGVAYPSRIKELGGTILRTQTKAQEIERDDLRAIRWSRLQETERILHNRCHDAYDGVTLPLDVHKRFLVTLLYAANYIPQQAIDLSKPRPKIITLDEYMRRQLLEPGILHKQKRMEARIGYYFGRYIVNYGLAAVKETIEVSQFLEAKDALERQRLGHRIIRNAAQVVIDPVEGIYQSARAKGRISQSRPKRALGFMIQHFDHKQPDYFDTIEQELKASLSSSAA